MPDPRSWSQVLSGHIARDFAYFEQRGEPLHSADYPWQPGHPTFAARYATPHQVDRAAVHAFVNAPDPTWPADLALALPSGPGAHLIGQAVYKSISSAFLGLVNHWEGDLDPLHEWPGPPAAVQRRGKAARLSAHYLHARGFDLQVLADLAEPVRTLLDGPGAGADGEDHDEPPRVGDDLDRLLDCLHAGLTTAEVRPGLTQGCWPEPQVVATLTALRAHA